MTSIKIKYIALMALVLVLGLVTSVSAPDRLLNDFFKTVGVHSNSTSEQVGTQIDTILANPTLGNKMISDNTVLTGFNAVADVSQTYHLAEMPAGALPNDIGYQNILTFMKQACSLVAQSENGIGINVKVQNFNGKTYVGCVHS
jgi:hypothetical protein